MSDKYFYAVGGRRHGPITLEEIKSLAARQELKRTALIWTEGMAAWQPAGQTTAIFEGLPPDLEPLTEPVTLPPTLPQAEAQNSANFLNEYFQVLRKYAVFNGRADKREFWTFFFVNLAVSVGLAIIDGIMEGQPGVLYGLYNLAVIIPYIGVGIRRMHDTDRSGWWILLPIGNIIYWAEAGKPGNNRFGPNPKTASS